MRAAGLPHTHLLVRLEKILILFYRSQVNPSMLILVIGHDMLCVAQLYLFFQTQREPSISTILVPTAYLTEDRASMKRLGISPKNLNYKESSRWSY